MVKRSDEVVNVQTQVPVGLDGVYLMIPLWRDNEKRTISLRAWSLCKNSAISRMPIVQAMESTSPRDREIQYDRCKTTRTYGAIANLGFIDRCPSKINRARRGAECIDSRHIAGSGIQLERSSYTVLPSTRTTANRSTRHLKMSLHGRTTSACECSTAKQIKGLGYRKDRLYRPVTEHGRAEGPSARGRVQTATAYSNRSSTRKIIVCQFSSYH